MHRLLPSRSLPPWPLLARIRRIRSICRILGLRLRTAVLVLTLDLASAVCEMAGAAMVMPILDYLQSGGDVAALAAQSRLWRVLVAVYAPLGLEISLPVLLGSAAAALAASISITYLQKSRSAVARADLVRRTRIAIFRDYLAVRLAYSEETPLGRLVHDVTLEVQHAVWCLFHGLAVIGLTVRLLVYAALAAAVSAPLFAMVVPVLLAAHLAARRFLQRTRATGERQTQTGRGLAAFLTERIHALRLIRLAGTRQAELAAMRRHAARTFDAATQNALIGARVVAATEAVGAIAILGFFYLGTELFALRVGEVGLFVAITFRLVPRLQKLLQERQQCLLFLASVEAVRQRIEAMRAAGERDGGGRPFTGLSTGITLQGVTFRYPGAGAFALQGIDLEIPARTMTALVGPSGSGKSTLIDLLPRLRDRTGGEIRVDGAPIDAFSLASLRQGFAFAPQTPQIFAATAAEHIAYGRPDATRAEIEAAARLAGAHDFIAALPGGYDAQVGADGVRLSGGQRQRLDLARTLIAGAPILVLDEPTGQLDVESERAVRDALRRLRRETDLTIIMIGHRLALAAEADRIVVLDAGRVVDVGAHAELLARDGWYAAAFRKAAGPS